MKIHRTREDAAVSSVVGVILMVALTVILAAVLAQFVFDLASMLQPPIQAGVTIQEQPITDTTDTTDYELRVVLSKLSNADRIVVNHKSNSYPISEVGGHRTIEASKGELVTVVAELNGRKTVIRTYEVGR